MQYFKEALNSVLVACSGVAKVIVSDNSEQGDVADYMQANHPEVTFLRRIPTLSSESHFKSIIREVNSEYVVLFHDDDIMLPNFIKVLFSSIRNAENVVAVGSNALFITDDELQDRKFYFGEDKRVIETPMQLVRQYFNFTSDGIMPFPSYLYRSKFLKPDYIDGRVAGKYNDVFMLISLLEHGKILWLKECCMHYRFHSQNDSNQVTATAYLRFFRLLYSKFGLIKLKNEFRFNMWYDMFRRSQLPGRSHSLVKKFLLQFFIIRLAFNPDFWKKVKIKIFPTMHS